MCSSTCLKRGHVFGVEVVLDVADDTARLADAPLAQEHDLKVVVPLAAAATSCEQGCQMAKFVPFLSLDCARVEGVWRAQSKERKGSNFAAQRSGAIVQKPEGPNT